MNRFFTIILSVIFNILILVTVLWLLPFKYFTTNPDKEWWTALSIITTVSFGVIAVGVTVIIRERNQKGRIDSLENKILESNNESKRINEIISGILQVQNAAENQSESIWDDLLTKIKELDFKGLISPLTLRTWSTVAWKQGHLKKAVLLREKAFEQDKNDFKSRVMLCSALTYEQSVDKTRIENILDNTDLKSDYISDENIDHYNNIRGAYHLRIGEFDKAQDCFSKSIEKNIQTWPFKGLIISMILDKSKTNEEIKTKIESFDKNSKWYDDTIVNMKPFRLMVSAILDKSKSNVFYSYFTPKKIAEIVKAYDCEFVKSKFFNGYEIIKSKYADKDIELIYLTYYFFVGAFDSEAEKEIKKSTLVKKINKMIKNAL
jgi:tetratricopeptide (TPR) repeat protein